MRNLLTVISFLIFTKVVLSGDPKDKLGYVLDVLGDNNYERVDTDFSDPSVTVFTPVNDSEIIKVIYGERVIWVRGKGQHFMKLMVFRVGHEHQFMHLHLKEGSKEKGLVFVRDGDKWKNTGKYDIHKSKETGEQLSPLSVISSKFAKLFRRKKHSKSRKSGESPDHAKDLEDFDEQKEKVDLEISGDPEDVSVVKKYISLGTPTIEYRPYFDKKIMRIVDNFQTIWKHENDKRPLKEVKGFNKLGETRLLLVMTGDDFHKHAYYYEYVNQEWRRIERDRFYFKLRMRLFNDIDPEFDIPTKEMIKDLGTIVSKSQEGSDLDLPIPERAGSLGSLESLIKKMKVPIPKRRTRTYTYDRQLSDDEEEKEKRRGIIGRKHKDRKDKRSRDGSRSRSSSSSSDSSDDDNEKIKIRYNVGDKEGEGSDRRSSRRGSSGSDSDSGSFRIRYHLGDKNSPITNTFSVKRDPSNEHSYKITKIEEEGLPRGTRRGPHSQTGSRRSSIDSIGSQDSGPYENMLPNFESGNPVQGPLKEEDITIISSPVQESQPKDDSSYTSGTTRSRSRGSSEKSEPVEDLEPGAMGEGDGSVATGGIGTLAKEIMDEIDKLKGYDIGRKGEESPVQETGGIQKEEIGKEPVVPDSGRKYIERRYQEPVEYTSGEILEEKPTPKPRHYHMPLKRVGKLIIPGQMGLGSMEEGTGGSGLLGKLLIPSRPRSLGKEISEQELGTMGDEQGSIVHKPGSLVHGPGVIDLIGQGSSSSGSTPEEDEYFSHPDMPKLPSLGHYPDSKSSTGSDSFVTGAEGDIGEVGDVGEVGEEPVEPSKTDDDAKPKTMTTSEEGASAADPGSSSSSGGSSFTKDYRKLFKDSDTSSTSTSSGSRSLPPPKLSKLKTPSSPLSPFHLSDVPLASTDDKSSSLSSHEISSTPESIFHMTDLDTPSDENDAQGNV